MDCLFARAVLTSISQVMSESQHKILIFGVRQYHIHHCIFASWRVGGTMHSKLLATTDHSHSVCDQQQGKSNNTHKHYVNYVSASPTTDPSPTSHKPQATSHKKHRQSEKETLSPRRCTHLLRMADNLPQALPRCSGSGNVNMNTSS